MTQEQTKEKVSIDARGKRVGRLATEVAVLLMGKNKIDFARNKVPNVTVEVENVDLLDIDPKKMEQKIYDHYTGYNSGRKEITMAKLIEKKGHKIILEKAVYGMLPGNKLRPLMMKNLVII